MGAVELLEQLDTLLVMEREAIQSLDGDAVARFADEKTEILQGLTACERELREKNLAPAIEAAVAGLRRNGVLLAHARACLRDLVGVLRSEHDGHVSVRG